MDGAFPRYSTSFVKPQYNGHYRHSTALVDEFNMMRYSTSTGSSSSRSNSTCSRQSYSPPKSNTPQRISRKPVSNNPMISKSTPQNEWKTSVTKTKMNPKVTTTTSHISSPLPSSSNRTATATATTTVINKLEPKPTFWYPRQQQQQQQQVNKEPLLKRGISKKIRGLLQPHKSLFEYGTSNGEFVRNREDSLNRCLLPELNQEENPFHILSNQTTLLNIEKVDFTQIDNYAITVQQRGPLLTPILLSQKFLVRPYRNDLYKLRALFIWIIQNIRPSYHQRRNDLKLLQKQLQLSPTMIPSKSTSTNIRQRLSKMTQQDDTFTTDEEISFMCKLDAMSLLQEEYDLLSENANDYINENPDEVLETRSCKSSFGMAHLFTIMAVAAGFEDAHVVYGYLKAPKDSTELKDTKLTINHAWCSVKIDGEYRSVDCWLASPFYPQNEGKMETHWFLTRPVDIILSHFPKDPLKQFLESPITQYAFFNIPYVRNAFFWNRLQVMDYKTQVNHDNSVFYLNIKLESNDISCYSETEGEDGITSRGLAQCLVTEEERIYQIKAVLPPNQTQGWLKVYVGPKLARANTTTQQQQVVHKHQYPLAMCIRIRQRVPEPGPFDFVQLYLDHNEFYVQEPQCYRLYPLQRYNFVIKSSNQIYANSSSNRRAVHHKLAIKSPSGRLVKLMYFPQDQTYDGNVLVAEAGKWSLICLLHHTGGWYTVATWHCSV